MKCLQIIREQNRTVCLCEVLHLQQLLPTWQVAARAEPQPLTRAQPYSAPAALAWAASDISPGAARQTLLSQAGLIIGFSFPGLKQQDSNSGITELQHPKAGHCADAGTPA